MQSFIVRLEARVRKVDSLLCVGLDPHLADLPEPTAAAARDFCLRLVEQTAPVAAAFKPNTAFFERFGPAGIAALQDVIGGIPVDIPVILDAKRGDIASTAQAYAVAAFETLGAAAITLNPYLGRDAVVPFLEQPDRGAFLLCKTSNPGAVDLQDQPLLTTTQPLYMEVARLAQNWNINNNLGLVVGATYPEALEQVRVQAPDLWFLVPGVGAQEANLKAALAAGLRADGLGMLVSVSRGVSRAANPGEQARTWAAEINRVRSERSTVGDAHSYPPLDGFGARLADGLLQSGCVRFGEFTLKSGLVSPIYIDLRRLAGDPQLLAQAAAAYRPLLSGLAIDRLAALPYAALPIATAISLQTNWPLVYPRKEVKTYGTKAAVEGPFNIGERVVVIDDLATTGASKFEAIEKLTEAGLVVEDVVVLIDRQSGAQEALAVNGYRLQAVMTLAAMLAHWALTGQVKREQVEKTRQFLAETS